MPEPHAPTSDASPETPVSVMVHLSGAHRGSTHPLRDDRVRVGTAPDAGVHLSPRDRPRPAETHATLERRGLTYELVVAPDQEVWVNGERVDRLVLASGDVVEIGRGGPVLRFRQYPPGSRAARSVPEVFSDCLECARHASDRRLGRLGALTVQLPRALATETTRIFRVSVLVVLALLTAMTVDLARRNRALEDTLAHQLERVGELVEELERTEPARVTEADVQRWREELARDVSEADRRLAALEARSGAAARVVAATSGSVVFLQGAYGFRDPDSGRPLRTVPDADGTPVRSPRGMPLVTLEGDGPVFQVLYTGTGFVVAPGGRILTNRHVALPWEFDQAALQIIDQGLEPVMLRFVGYLPDHVDPVEMTTLAASLEADVALLGFPPPADSVHHLPLAAAEAEPGDQVIVLGYPLGLRALLARLEPDEIQLVVGSDDADFFQTAERLAGGGHVAPLASQGIVSQSTSRFLVYDAETTSGGSGGPVLNLDGRVVAVNAAVLPEFGGSNLGVPIVRGRALMDTAAPPAREP